MMRRMAGKHRARRWRRGMVVVLAGAVALSCSRNKLTEQKPEPASTESSSAPPGAPPADLSRQQPPVEVADMDLPTAERALAHASKELGIALGLAAPDCSIARTLRDRVCALADRICKLGGADPDVAARCKDGQSRCIDAKDRVGSRCP